MRALAVSATIGAAAGWLFEVSQQVRNLLALLVIFLLSGCITIPTEGQQGGSNVMFSHTTWDASTGKKTSECIIGRDALAARATFKTVDVDNPCAILLEGVDQTQGDATLTGEALQLQAAQMSAVTMAVISVLQARGLIPQ